MERAHRPAAQPTTLLALEERTFHDALYEWMERAPWLALSAAAHLLVFFVLMAVPWELLERPEPVEIRADLATPEELPFEEPLEPPPELLEEPVLADPELQESVVADASEEPLPSEAPATFAESLPDTPSFEPVLGVGGAPPGSKVGPRTGPGRREGGQESAAAVRRGLAWLAAHQTPDGSWDGDDFADHCGALGSTTCSGPGQGHHDVGLTGLALLAFLGDGHTTSSGEYRDVVNRGIQWLLEQRDPDTGLLGERNSKEFVYDHAIATLALTESYFFVKSPRVKRVAQDAIHYIVRARNPYGAWRYDVPPIGDSDTSVTGWMVFALASAKDAGLEVDEAAFDGALGFLDEVTDPASGRVGYDSLGTLSSRTLANEHFPREKGEAMTAVGLLCRIFVAATRGEELDRAERSVLEAHADRLLAKLPEWDPEGFGCDMYYWYYGSYAMFQMDAAGAPYWRRWRRAMEDAIVPHQRTEGDERGSWDPVGPWGHAGGRVYSTALMVLCLEVYYRYANVLGAR